MAAKVDLDTLLHRGVAEVIVEADLRRELEQGRRLRVKMGFDPSAPDIHLGHVVGLRKLRQFQELGHQVILVVGDWTARIGDPSGQSATRPMITPGEVQTNAETYMQQFFRVVDRYRTDVVWQSEWFRQFDLDEVIHLTSNFTVAQMLAREDFARRYAAGSPISLTELLYPLLQAYDSVATRADVEAGGLDQKFNILVGRELQRLLGMEPQQAFLTPILVGTDGANKMSKSLGNYIGVTDPPDEMYGKIMSIPDDLLTSYFVLLTDVPQAELDEIGLALAERRVNPRDVKARLAREIVGELYSPAAAQAAEEEFNRVFRRRELPSEIPIVYLGRSAYAGRPVNIVDLLVVSGLVSSRSEARRMVAQGAVELGGERVSRPEAEVTVEPGQVLRVGKRRYARLLFRD